MRKYATVWTNEFADRLAEKEIPRDLNRTEFINYCYMFYGPGEIYDIKATKKELKAAADILQYMPGWNFVGDSIDREHAKELVLIMRNKREGTLK